MNTEMSSVWLNQKHSNDTRMSINLITTTTTTGYAIKCITFDSLSEKARAQVEWLNQLCNILRLLGSPVNTVNETQLFALTIFASLLVNVILSLLKNQDNPLLRVNCVDVHMTPELERRRLRSSLKAHLDCLLSEPADRPHQRFPVLADLYESEDSSGDDREFQQRKSSSVNQLDTSSNLVDRCSGGEYTLQKSSRSSNLTIHMHIITEQQEFIRYFINKKHQLLDLQPAHLSVSNYRELMNLELLVAFICILAGIFIAAITDLGLGYRELSQRARQRFEELQCEQWNPNSFPISYPVPLIKLTKQQEQQNSTGHQYLLTSDLIEFGWPAYRRELNEMFTKNTILFFSELSLSYIMLTHLISTLFALVIIDNRNAALWFDQLREQFGEIMQQLDLVRCHEDLISSSSKGGGEGGSRSTSEYQSTNHRHHHHHPSKSKRFIELKLIQSYLNFVLLIRELNYNKHMFVLVASQICTAVLITVILCFIGLSESTKQNRLVVWFITMIAVFLLNGLGYLSSRIGNMAQKLFENVNNMMAKTSQIGMKHSHIVQLWRVQIICPAEIELMFGTSVLGVDLSHSNLLQFNTYVLGASIYFLSIYFFDG